MVSNTYKAGRGPFFAQVPFLLMDDPDKDAFVIATYAAIRSFADFGSDTGAKVSDARLSERAGCSPRTVRERRNWLRDKGWLDWEPGKGEGDPNTYVIHSSPPLNGEPARQETPTPPAPGADPPRHEVPPTENQRPTSNTDTSEGDLFGAPVDVAEAMHDTFVRILGGDPPHPKLTAKRKKLYLMTWGVFIEPALADCRMIDEELHLGTPNLGMAIWASMCGAVAESEWHREKREYQMPESFLRNDERRERWLMKGIERLRKPKSSGPQPEGDLQSLV